MEVDNDDEGYQDEDWTSVQVTPGRLGKRIPDYIIPELSPADQDLVKNAKSAIDFYELFMPEEYHRMIIQQSLCYACSKGMEDKMKYVTYANLR